MKTRVASWSGLLLMMIAISGCAGRFVASAEAIDQRLEGEVDAIMGFMLKRFCSLPIDVILRTTTDQPWTAQAFMACPSVRALMAQMQLNDALLELRARPN